MELIRLSKVVEVAVLNLQSVLDKLELEQALEEAVQAAELNEITWNDGINAVFSVIVSNTSLAPTNVKNSKDGKISAIEKWVLKYHRVMCP